MTKQELIQDLKDIASTPNNKDAILAAASLIINYTIFNDGDIGYWYRQCMNVKVEMKIEQEIQEESEMSKIENNVSSRSEDKVSDPNSPSRFSFGKK